MDETVSRGRQKVAQTCHDLGLAGGGRPGDGKQNRRAPGGNEPVDALDEGPVDLGVGCLEILVADGMAAVETLLLRLEHSERHAAQVRRGLVGEIGRAVQEEEAANVKVEVRVDPLRRVVPRHQPHEQHARQPDDGFVQHDLVLDARLDLDADVEFAAVDLARPSSRRPASPEAQPPSPGTGSPAHSGTRRAPGPRCPG